MCRLCDDQNSRSSYARASGPVPFVILPSASTVIGPCGRIITRSYFLEEILKWTPSVKDGSTVSPQPPTSLLRERHIRLTTPPKNLLRPTIEDCRRLRNPNLVSRREFRESVHPSSLHWFISIVRDLEEKSLKREMTYSELLELRERYIRYLRTCLQSCGRNWESRQSIVSDFFQRNIESGSRKLRKQRDGIRQKNTIRRCA